ncbi:MAG: family 16 glycoside hydrolase [Flavisolibacter sp.]
MNLSRILARPGLTLTFATALLIYGCAAQKNATGEWEQLFDGKTLNGWELKQGNATFTIEDGVLVGSTFPNNTKTFLGTKKEYGNFILELDFKADEGLNSGIQFRSRTSKDYRNGIVNGYQVEIDPAQKELYSKYPLNYTSDGQVVKAGTAPRNWTGGIYDEKRREWIGDLTHNEAARKAFRPGEWNHIRLEANKDAIRTWINGVPAATLVDFVTPNGFIALQVHETGNEPSKKIFFKNIRIRDLGLNAEQPDAFDPFIGEYKTGDGSLFAQVYKVKGKYKTNLVRELISRQAPVAILDATETEGGLNFSGEGWTGSLKEGKLNLVKDKEQYSLRPFGRTSPTLNAAPPADAIVLYNGTDLKAWKKVLEKDWLEGSDTVDNFQILPGGALQVVPHAAGLYESLISKQQFGDLHMHLEFRLQGEPTNGGVYLMSRYEINIKDAFGVPGTPIGFGNVSKPKDLYPDVNVAFPPMKWQTFDIDFRAPRFNAAGTKKTENARITLVHNGVTIYKDVEIEAVKGSTAKLGEAGVGPIYLQEHGNPYQFRNIWVIDKTVKGTEHFSIQPKEKKSGGGGGKKGGSKKGKDVESGYEEELNPAYKDTDINLVADASGKPAPPAGFTHPGVLMNAEQLDEIKRRINAGVEPQKSAFEKLKASPLAAPDYQPHPVPTVSCGPRSNPDLGCKAEQADCAAAYTQALLWKITGDKRYADNAIRIMNAWSSTLTGGHNYANGPVQAAWCGSVWPRAAEIIRYTYNGWSASDIAKFQNMLRVQYLPTIIHGDCENGNKELAMCEALINIGVFLDDRTVFEHGLRMWRGRAPAYIYLESDGPEPIEPPGCGPAIWGNKGYTPEFVDGLLQETARDEHHPWMAYASMANAAETARQQNVDLYGEEAKRMMAALEFQAQYLPPNNTPIPENLKFGMQPTWEIAFNHFHNRLGFPLPKMAAVIPGNRPTGTDHHMLWETLTHADMGSIGLKPLPGH